VRGPAEIDPIIEVPMGDAILVLNAGSSSLKFSIYELAGEHLALEARGQIEGLGGSPRFRAADGRGQPLAGMPLSGEPAGHFGHAEALASLVRWVQEQFRGQLSPVAVGHRVVHGGWEFTGPTLIDPQVLVKLERLVPLAPLHQPHSLAAVRAVAEARPDLTQVACFDTAFHRGRSTVTERFGLPDELFRSGVRRWGFHGLSYESVIGRFPEFAPAVAGGRVIVAHLGSGASLCAIENGRSVETTMGFSVLDGLPMGTRCGCLDPGVILFLLRRGMNADRIEKLLYTESGLLGISGVSNDVRDLLASDRPSAAEAIDYFVYRTVREIGSLAAALRGLDALVFTAGVGENSPVIREYVCAGLSWLGVELDPAANRRGRGMISPPDGSPSVWVIPTDEEHVIAAGTLKVLRSAMEPQPTG
jgi:acetate kinase